MDSEQRKNTQRLPSLRFGILLNTVTSLEESKMACSTYSGTFPLPFYFRLAEEKISLRGEKMSASRSKNELGEKTGLDIESVEGKTDFLTFIKRAKTSIS